MRSPSRRSSLLGVVCTLALLASCSGGDAETTLDDEGDDGVSSVTVAPPEARLTPFCQAMIDLSDELDDSPDDPTGVIIETYEGIVDEVPGAIEPDFLVVLADLQDGTTPTDLDSVDSSDEPDTAATATSIEDFDAEGRVPTGDNSAERLSNYIDLACRDNVNNPGPPATEPLDDLTFDEDSATVDADS